MSKRIALLAAFALLLPAAGRAHCDTLDGPVVASARAALDAREVKLVLRWVKAGAPDREIRAAFQKALEARDRNPAARERSDRRFLEAVVRVHRAGEGASFTGLKPAGHQLDPAIRAGDQAVASGSGEPVEHLLVEAITEGLRKRLATLKARTAAPDDVEGGRAWVAAYVDYIHYVEALSAAAKGPPAHGEAGHHEHARHGAAGARVAGQAHAH